MTDEEKIHAGSRIASFLADDAVTAVFAELDKQYWNEVKFSSKAEEREDAAVNARALEALRLSLQAVVDSGRIATAKVALAADRERAKRR